VDSFEGGVNAGTVTQIADGHVRGAVCPHRVSIGRASYESAHFGATLGKRRKHEAGKLAGCTDCEDGRVILFHVAFYGRCHKLM